jgi:transporter family protein
MIRTFAGGWLFWALLVAVFAAATAILAKVGVTLKLGEAARVAVIGVAFLGEQLSWRNWLGVAMIASGAAPVGIRQPIEAVAHYSGFSGCRALDVLHY